MAPHLSKRGKQTLPLLERIGEYIEPHFPSLGCHPRSDDLINLATAENWLLRPRLVPKFQEYISNNFTASDLSYVPGLGGAPQLLRGLADFFNAYFGPHKQVVSSQIVTAPGSSHLLESVLFHLCEPDEAVLIQTPYWPDFDDTLMQRNDFVLTLVNVQFDGVGANPFAPDIVDAYQFALNTSPAKVRAMIICNPHNPLGRCYTVQALEALLLFAENNDLQVVVDELYGLSVFSPVDKFYSVLSIDLNKLGVDPSRIHMVYSFSKDLNSSGIRLGVFVTQTNKILRDSIAAQQLSKISSFTSVAGTQLLQDKTFLREIVAANPGLLRSNFYVAQTFLEYYCVPFILPTAGVFIFANFLAITGRPVTEEEEIELEGEFRVQGVKINGGNHFHSISPGYFRLIFAVEKEKLITGLHRIEAALNLKGWSEPATDTKGASSFQKSKVGY